MKSALEDLANDQIAYEKQLAGLRKEVLLAFGLGLLALGVAAVAVRALKALGDGMGQVGGALLATQQHVGMIQGPPGPIPQPPARPKVTPEPGTTDAVVGQGYDPGPQPIAEDVKEAILAEPVVPLLDEPTDELH